MDVMYDLRESNDIVMKFIESAFKENEAMNREPYLLVMSMFRISVQSLQLLKLMNKEQILEFVNFLLEESQ